MFLFWWLWGSFESFCIQWETIKMKVIWSCFNSGLKSGLGYLEPSGLGGLLRGTVVNASFHVKASCSLKLIHCSRLASMNMNVCVGTWGRMNGAWTQRDISASLVTYINCNQPMLSTQSPLWAWSDALWAGWHHPPPRAARNSVGQECPNLILVALTWSGLSAQWRRAIVLLLRSADGSCFTGVIIRSN